MTSSEILEKLEQYKRLRESLNNTIDYLVKSSDNTAELNKILETNYLIDNMPSQIALSSKDLKTKIGYTINYLRTVVIPACDEKIASLVKMQNVG